MVTGVQTCALPISRRFLAKVNPEHAEALMTKCEKDAKKRRARLDRMVSE